MYKCLKLEFLLFYYCDSKANNHRYLKCLPNFNTDNRYTVSKMTVKDLSDCT